MTYTEHRRYVTPETELAEYPLSMVFCEMSVDLVDIEEEDAGIVNWE